MFERLEKPYLTVDTGEAYQPIRLSYAVKNQNGLIDILNNTQCLDAKNGRNAWDWLWKNEADSLNFESISSFKKNTNRPTRLGTLTLKDNSLSINLPSFKRACLALPFFYEHIKPETAEIDHADFINKVYGIDERLPHGFTELFDDAKLDSIIQERIEEFEKVQQACEKAKNSEEALNLLNEYSLKETSKRLPYAERYSFEHDGEPVDPEITFLSFYIFLRGRELVAIKRWFGNPDYTLANAADETIEEIFGGIGIDLLD